MLQIITLNSFFFWLTAVERSILDKQSSGSTLAYTVELCFCFLALVLFAYTITIRNSNPPHPHQHPPHEPRSLPCFPCFGSFFPTSKYTIAIIPILFILNTIHPINPLFPPGTPIHEKPIGKTRPKCSVRASVWGTGGSPKR